jgi:YVTN family beta-propeller protein
MQVTASSGDPELWASAEIGGAVGVISHKAQYLMVGQRVWQLAFTPDKTYSFATNGLSNDVAVIDVASHKVVKTIQSGEQSWDVVFIAEP